MITVDNFTLYDFAEFSTWLSEYNVTRVIKLVQNHHTYIPGYAHFTGNNHIELLKGMERSHIERGFSEIAQNLTTFNDGKVALCRSLDKIPAGIKGANSNGICIENLGNFDLNQDEMTEPHKNLIVNLNALLCKKFNLTPGTDTVVYHHWYDLTTGQRTLDISKTKSCPGTNFFGGNTIDNCHNNFISLISSAMDNLSGVTSGTIDVTTLQHGIVAVSTLNVRSANNTTASILKILHQGTPIAIYESLNGWYRIDAGQQWVKSDFVQLS